MSHGLVAGGSSTAKRYLTWFEIYVGLEAEATTISATTPSSSLACSRLPTTRAVHKAYLFTATDEAIEQRVQVRMAQQERLTAGDGLHVWFVVNEAVIRRKVGGRAVMHDQLARLVAAAELPNVTVQVVPFDIGAHPSMDGAFSILGFPEETDLHIVYIEYQTGALYLERPDEVRRYRLIFDHLRAAALPVDASRTLIARQVGELA